MKPLFRFGPGQDGIRVEDMWVNPRPRDDISKLLGCLREPYLDVALREEVFRLLEDRLGSSGTGGSPEFSLWTLLVLGLLKRRLGCDFDRLHERATTHVVVRQLLGYSEFDSMKYSCAQILRNVSLLDEDALRAINELVVRHDQHLRGHEPGERLSGRCNSFVVETDVHCPTDRNLLRDSARVHGTGSWRRRSRWREAASASSQSGPCAEPKPNGFDTQGDCTICPFANPADDRCETAEPDTRRSGTEHEARASRSQTPSKRQVNPNTYIERARRSCNRSHNQSVKNVLWTNSLFLVPSEQPGSTPKR